MCKAICINVKLLCSNCVIEKNTNEFEHHRKTCKSCRNVQRNIRRASKRMMLKESLTLPTIISNMIKCVGCGIMKISTEFENQGKYRRHHCRNCRNIARNMRREHRTKKQSVVIAVPAAINNMALTQIPYSLRQFC